MQATTYKDNRLEVKGISMKIVRKILEYLRGEPQHLGKLIKRGLKVGKNFHRMGGVIIDPSHCYHITIGDNVTLAPRVHILAHDSVLIFS